MLLLGAAANIMGRPIKIYKNGKLFSTIGDKLKGPACEICFESSSTGLNSQGHWTNKNSAK